ncbi:MAG: GGDEF domain-containing protein [Mesorhizobium sp.]|nr:GGDEF domain-containing protein [Mesorhizobium sp.]
MIQPKSQPKDTQKPVAAPWQGLADSSADRRSEPMLDRFIRDEALMAETERLLSGRTREIRLTGDLAEAYRQRTWRQTAKTIRSWMIWVIILDLMMMSLNFVLLPGEIAWAMLAPSAMIVPAAGAVAFIWWKPRSEKVLGGSLIAGMAVILLSVSWMGTVADGPLVERYLDIMLFVAITGIIIFGIPFAQTLVIAALALTIYLAFLLGAADEDTRTAMSGFFFFASGLGATVVARRTMNILAQKSFLLELRDRRRMAELADTNQQLQRLSRIDGLTGAANRHFMRERMEALSQENRQVALLMCDIDDFKPLNDHLGHVVGDRCLVEVARIIMECTRSDVDCVARFGGEEFLVLLVDAGEEVGMATAERIRAAVAAANLPNPGSRVTSTLTLSIGVAAGTGSTAGRALEDLQLQADTALYSAKRAGRNRVWLWRGGFETPGRLGSVG